MISDVAEAKSILAQDKNFMVIMEMDFTCWIRTGIRNDKNILVANGKKIAQISDDVLEVLSKDMDQEYCSEFFQKQDGLSA